MDFQSLCEQCKLLESLKNINLAIKSRNPNEKTEQHLRRFSKLLQSSFYCIDIKSHSVFCEFCQSEPEPDFIILNCSHIMCSEKCFQSWIFHQLEDNFHLYDKVKCICGQRIERMIVTKAMSSMEGFHSKVRQSALNAEPSSSCEICYKIKKISDFLTFDCEHRFCRECIQSYIQDKIRQGIHGDRLVCPNCPSPIDYNIIFNLLDDSLRSLYDRLSLRSINLKEEILFQCPQGCNYAVVIAKTSESEKCTVCNLIFCIKCKDEVHLNQTCEENKKLKAFISEPLLKEKYDQGLLKYCPWCLSGVEKDPRGCKYMTCQSPECKGKKWFCFDCLVKLNKFHEKHECKTPEVQTRDCQVF